MTILKNILTFSGLVVGVPVSLPHLLNVRGVDVVPQLVAASAANFTIVPTTTQVTVTRTAAAPADVQVYVERWHSITEVYLSPADVGTVPFVIASGDGTGGGATGPTGPTGATGATGATGPTGATGAAGAQDGAMFFGTTTGTGSLGNDYAATVAVGAPVPFPRNGPTTVGASATRSGVSTTNFLIANTGVYEVSWQVGFSEASQLQLAVNGAAVANTCSSSGAGTQQNTNTVLVSLTAADIVTVINPAGNATALTVTPSDGTLTHAQAPNLMIKRLS